MRIRRGCVMGKTSFPSGQFRSAPGPGVHKDALLARCHGKETVRRHDREKPRMAEGSHPGHSGSGAVGDHRRSVEGSDADARLHFNRHVDAAGHRLGHALCGRRRDGEAAVIGFVCARINAVVED